MKTFNSIKQDLKDKEEEDYIKMLDYFIQNYEIILYNQRIRKQKKGKRLIKKIEKNMPIENIIDYLEQNEENLNIFNKDKKRKYIIEGEDIERKKLFNCSFYEELMYKKNEILNSLLLGDKINKNKNKKERR